MENIASCLLCCINGKVYYYQPYGKNHNMLKITILVESCDGQNKNNVMILFMNMVNDVLFFVKAILHLYIKGYKNNDCCRVLNSLKVLYWKRNVFTFEKFCEILNTINNIGVIQMLHENFDLD